MPGLTKFVPWEKWNIWPQMLLLSVWRCKGLNYFTGNVVRPLTWSTVEDRAQQILFLWPCIFERWFVAVNIFQSTLGNPLTALKLVEVGSIVLRACCPSWKIIRFWFFLLTTWIKLIKWFHVFKFKCIGKLCEQVGAAGPLNRCCPGPLYAQMLDILECSRTRPLTKPKNTNKDLDAFSYNIFCFYSTSWKIYKWLNHQKLMCIDLRAALLCPG